MGLIFWLAVILGSLYAVARFRPSLQHATIVGGIILLVAWVLGLLSGFFGLLLTIIAVALGVLFNVRSLRLSLVSTPLLKYVRAVLPPMSDTERVAIDAGTVWWEADLFQGDPDWQKLLNYPEATLTEEEQAFVDGPTNELCAIRKNMAGLGSRQWHTLRW